MLCKDALADVLVFQGDALTIIKSSDVDGREHKTIVKCPCFGFTAMYFSLMSILLIKVAGITHVHCLKLLEDICNVYTCLN